MLQCNWDAFFGDICWDTFYETFWYTFFGKFVDTFWDFCLDAFFGAHFVDIFWGHFIYHFGTWLFLDVPGSAMVCFRSPRVVLNTQTFKWDGLDGMGISY